MNQTKFNDGIPLSNVWTWKQGLRGDFPTLVNPRTWMQYDVNGFKSVIIVFVFVILKPNTFSVPFSLYETSYRNMRPFWSSFLISFHLTLTVCASSAFVSCFLMIGAELGALVASQSKRIRRSMSANIFIKLRMLYFRRSMTDMTIIKHEVWNTSCHTIQVHNTIMNLELFNVATYINAQSHVQCKIKSNNLNRIISEQERSSSVTKLRTKKMLGAQFLGYYKEKLTTSINTLTPPRISPGDINTTQWTSGEDKGEYQLGVY